MVSIVSFQIQRDALIPFIFLRYPHIVNNPQVSIDKKRKECILTFFCKKEYILLCLGSPYRNRCRPCSFPKVKNKSCKSKKKRKPLSFCVLNRLLLQLGDGYMTPFSLFMFYILILFIIVLCKHNSVIF